MGTGDADHGRRLDRTALEKINAVRINDTAYLSNVCRIDEHVEAKQVRLVYFSKDTGEVLAWTILRSDEAYEFAHDILRKFDIIEGIAE
jgi:hypothetical protein